MNQMSRMVGQLWIVFYAHNCLPGSISGRDFFALVNSHQAETVEVKQRRSL